jgi:hypothetical protein
MGCEQQRRSTMPFMTKLREPQDILISKRLVMSTIGLLMPSTNGCCAHGAYGREYLVDKGSFGVPVRRPKLRVNLWNDFDVQTAKLEILPRAFFGTSSLRPGFESVDKWNPFRRRGTAKKADRGSIRPLRRSIDRPLQEASTKSCQKLPPLRSIISSARPIRMR